MKVVDNEKITNGQEFKVHRVGEEVRNTPRKTELMRAIEYKNNASIAELLWSLYVDQEKNMEEIGNCLGVAESTVRIWLIRFDIPLRTVSEARKLTDLTHHAEVMRGIQDARREAAFGGDLRESLIRMHHTQGLTPQQIAKKTGYNYTVVVTYMTENGIRNMTPPVGWIKKHKEMGDLFPDLWSDPAFMSCLAERELYVITRRHVSGDAPTFVEVAEELDVTKEAVHQIENRAFAKLKEAILQRTTTK